jgi:hypothetical protein
MTIMEHTKNESEVENEVFITFQEGIGLEYLKEV